MESRRDDCTPAPPQSKIFLPANRWRHTHNSELLLYKEVKKFAKKLTNLIKWTLKAGMHNCTAVYRSGLANFCLQRLTDLRKRIAVCKKRLSELQILNKQHLWIQFKMTRKMITSASAWHSFAQLTKSLLAHSIVSMFHFNNFTQK